MSSDAVIRLRGVGKSFPKFEKPYQRLFHFIAPRRDRRQEFRALADIDLDIHRGEAVGIIGRNGSGKSTLLQIVAGILQPSAGQVQVSARIAALLELGAGFNPEFTGRENIRLNASLLGLDEAQINARMDRIVAFAEIGEHVEQQVKTYSSGMFVRLAFAVAVHTDPEVLIVDESLSVGDIYFQRKCHKRIEEMRQQGCTLLFVTHAIDSLLQLCDRGVLLDDGRVAFDGPAKSAVKEYLRRVFGDNAAGEDGETEEGRDDQATARTDALAGFIGGGHTDHFALRPGYNRDETRVGDGSAVTCDFLITSSHGFGPVVTAREPFRISVRYSLPIAHDRLIFGLRVCTVTGAVVYSSNTLVASGRLFACDAGTVAIADFDLRCALLRGHYFVTVGVSRHDAEEGIVAVDRRTDAIVLSVLGDATHAEGLADLEASISVAASGAGEIRAVT
jgi:lipopolysaccharide transport system ATP-binding protein